jgi:hypothetical protein
MTYSVSASVLRSQLLRVVVGSWCLLHTAQSRARDPAPGDAELRVNAETALIQQSAAIALASGGSFVVVWQSEVEGLDDEIRARRFAASGEPLGGELEVNTLHAGPQNLPALALDAAGNFVVVWQSLVASNFQIRARRFDATGQPRGDEFLVSTRRGDTHAAPVVVMARNGGFVVAWESPLQGSYEIRARLFDAQGVAQGGEIAVNTLTASSQRSPALAVDASGNFVVVWRSNIAGSFELRAQRFNAKAVAQGSELPVNAFRAGDQLAPAVAMDARGNFVVVWENALDDQFEIRSRRFSAQGVALAEEAAVSSESAGEQFSPAVAMSAHGDFVVTWHGEARGDAEIRARTFSRQGVARGGELAVNSVSAGTQKSAAVAMNARGDFAVCWHSDAAGSWDIAARRYAHGER